MSGFLGTMIGSPIYGEIAIEANSTPMLLLTKNTYYPITVPSWTYDQTPSLRSYNLTNGSITLLASGAFTTLLTMSVSGGSGGFQTYYFQMFKNGVPVPDHFAVAQLVISTKVSVTITGFDVGNVGDVYQVQVTNTYGNDGYITVYDANFSMV